MYGNYLDFQAAQTWSFFGEITDFGCMEKSIALSSLNFQLGYEKYRLLYAYLGKYFHIFCKKILRLCKKAIRVF